MKARRSIYDEKIQAINERNKGSLTETMKHKDFVSLGAYWYEEINDVNVAYGQIADSSEPDNVNAYYIACEILNRIPYEVVASDRQDNPVDMEEYKEILANEILNCAMGKRTTKILVFEPHHDDFMGSASTILYANPQKVQTIVYTLTGGDRRDRVDLSALCKTSNIPSQRATSVIKHVKCNLKDFHYDLRYELINEDNYSDTTSYADLVEYYTHCGGSVEKLSEYLEQAITDFVETEANGRYVLLPLGLQHPMHILTAYYGVKAALKVREVCKDFDILFYVDHPYDFYVKDTNRLEMAKAYYSQQLNCEYLRADGTSLRQSDVATILSATYTEKHYGEFSGTLEKTVCSYLVPKRCLESLKQIVPLHVNNVLYVTFQAKPFLKSGGSGEVAYSYMKALLSYVNESGIIMPKYKTEMNKIAEKYIIGTNEDGEYYQVRFAQNGKPERIGKLSISPEIELLDYNFDLEEADFKIKLGDTERSCRIEKYCWQGVIYYLLDIEGCFDQENVFDHPEIERDCAAFNLAVMESLKNGLDFSPTILHCNDYQTALTPFLRKIKFANLYPDLKTVYTIHFYGYKGIFSKEKVFDYLGISERTCDYCLVCRKDSNCLLNSVNAYSSKDIAKLGIPDDMISLMKTGIVCADFVNTVSKGYAETIQNYPDFKGVKVYGIRNGISMVYPKLSSKNTDYRTPTKQDWEIAKRHNKVAFQEEFGLDRNMEIPMFCMVSRLNATKGIEDIKNIFLQLMKLDLQLVIVGDDDKNARNFSPYAKFFAEQAAKYPKKFFYSCFKEELEFKAYSAADVLLMPSRSEACGTTQILAMKYGVLPVVSMLSSFNDTIIDYNSVEIYNKDNDYVEKIDEQLDKGIGFFSFPDDCWALLGIIKMICKKLKSTEKDKKWKSAVNSTLTVDFSWHNNSIREYLELYDGL